MEHRPTEHELHEARLTAYALGELNGTGSSEFDDRLKSDAAFRAEVEAIRASARSLEKALQHGAAVIEINPLETPLSPHANQCLRGPASEVLTTLVNQLGTVVRQQLRDEGTAQPLTPVHDAKPLERVHGCVRSAPGC